jgi:predicted GIY-YIG superfamily endonuclease
MRTKWTIEKCQKIADNCNTLLEFRKKHNDAFCAVNRHGWQSLVLNKLIKNDTKWRLKSTVIKEALKYKSIKEFSKGSKGAYEACKKNKWDADVFKHMEKKTGFWNDYELCKKEAKKYKSRNEFQKNSSGAYGSCIRNGWLDDICTHMPSQNKNWTKVEIKNVALEFSSRGEFSKNNKGAYLFALRRGWLDEVCEHMKPKLKTWTKEQVLKLARKCKTRIEFRRLSGSACQYAERNGFMEEACEHMDIVGNLYNRMIYCYEFKDKSVYIGLTYKESKRKYEHLYEKKGPVAKYIKKTNLTPLYKKLTDYVGTKEAVKLEQKYISDYLNKGWNVLNSNKGGAIGGNKVIWTKDACHEIAKMFDKKLDFYNSLKYSGAVQAASKHGWMEEICAHMKGNTRWTEEKCIKEAKKYTKKVAFMRKSGGAYNYARRHNFLDKICGHMK